MKQKYIEKRITGECVKENDLKKNILPYPHGTEVYPKN